jgi:FixJ family two-component response regulator
VQEIQFRIFTRDGEIRWIDHTCRPVVDQEGQFQGTRASNRDVTDKKAAEAKAQQLRDELSHVTRVATLGGLTSSLAHELNQPLSAILNYAGAAQRFLAAAEPNLIRVGEALQGIIRDDIRAAKVIRGIRSLLKKEEIRYESLSLNDVIEEILDLIGHDSALAIVSITRELDPALPPIWGDRVQLQQVIHTLILNAAAAMSRGMLDAPRVVLRTEVWEDPGVKVSVRDFSAGIDEANKDRLFEPFYTTKPEGLGMGGSLSAKTSSKRMRARFGPRRTLMAGPHSILPCGWRQPRAPEKMNQTTVFVVDDDDFYRDFLKLLLESAGLVVRSFSSARAFLDEADPGTPGCLLLDVRMPGMSGLDLQNELAHAKISLPIIFITGHGTIPMSVRAIKAGAVDFLEKPFHEQDLFNAIHRAIELDRQTRPEREKLGEIRQLFDSLSPREQQVFTLVASGMLNKQIACRLAIAEGTVKAHRGRIMEKMKAHSLADLVRHAEKLGVGKPLD